MCAGAGDPSGPPWLRRPELLDRLEDVAGAGGVAVLAAEPGAGKTVLLRQWLADRDGPAVCVSGAASDDLPAALEALTATNALVVVDRTELLTAEQLAAVGRAAEGRGAGSALVLAGRHDPGLPLAEPARGGPVLELDGEDLAFTREEVGRVIALWRREVPPDEADAVAWATEGWCAGVRLAAVIGPQVLDDGGTSLRHHLLAEALADAPAALRDAVVALSVADTFDAATVDAVIAPPEGGAAVLRTLRTRRLFLRSAGEPGWWRLHRLFRGAALERLDEGPPARTLELHQRVARHALSGGVRAAPSASAPEASMTDAMAADVLLAVHAPELLLDARLPPPSASALAHGADEPPAVRAAFELALLAAGDLPTAARLAGDRHEDGETELLLDLLRARHAGDLRATEAAAIMLAREAPRGGRDALAWLELGALEHDLGHYDGAEDHLLLAAAQAEHAHRPAVAARAWATLAQVAAVTGRLREAERHATTAMHAAHAAPEAAVRAGLARVAVTFTRDELEVAAQHVAETRHAASGTRDPVLWFNVLVWEVAVLEARGLDDRATACLAEAQDVLARCPYRPVHATALDLYRVRLLDRAGRTEEASRVIDTVAEHAYAAADLVIARRRLGADDPAGALEALTPRLAEARIGPRELTIWHLLTYAQAVDRLGDSDEAHRALEQALAQAVRDGVRRPFADDAARARPLLTRHLKRDTRHAAFVAELLDHIEDARPAPEARLAAPLTERERVVLGYLPTAMTAAEIATALTVSEATIRTHLRHIYEKLDAPGRRDAVRRARELRLLAPGRE
jgi:LuxR family maltose regulon positive regulatory protein